MTGRRAILDHHGGGPHNYLDGSSPERLLHRHSSEAIGTSGNVPSVDTVPAKKLSGLGCLVRISELEEQRSRSLPDVLREIVCLLPLCWQYPEICHARVTVREQSYETRAFRESSWRQAAMVRVQGQTAGKVEVFYEEPMPECEEGPFLHSERGLLDAVAARIGVIADRCLLREELESTREALQEAKAAFRGLFSQIDEERAEISRSISANVERVLLPQLRALAQQIPRHQKNCLAVLERSLAELTDPFTRKVASVCCNLTLSEIEICNLIRSGMSTKEIAKIRHVSAATVFKQRESIRRKLSIVGTNKNLAAHLIGLLEPAKG